MSWFFDIEVEAAPLAEGALCSVDFPRAHTRVYGDRLDIAGWAMGRHSRATAVEAGIGGRDTARVTPALPRADVAAAFADIPHAGHSGFYLVADVAQVERAEVAVSIVLEADEKVKGAVLCLTRRSKKAWSAIEAPLVSVVIPCFNQARFLGEAIESARRQTYPRVEIIVVDDGSTDETAEVAAQLGVRCIRQENRGLGGARNRGLAESSGEYLVFLDADDRLLPHGLEANVEAFEERPDAAFVSGWGRLISPTGDPIPWPYLPPVPPEREHYAALLADTYGIPCPGAVMFRREPLIAAGGYRGSFPGTEDWDLYLRMARDYAIYPHAGGPISEYRQHPGGMSRNAARMLASCLAALNAQRKSTRHEPSLEAARRRGAAAVRNFYRQPLAEELATSVRRRNWRDAIRVMVMMLRVYPAGLPAALSHARGAFSPR